MLAQYNNLLISNYKLQIYPSKPMMQSDDPNSSAIPTLYYPQIRGIAQPVRNLFYYLNVKFNEVSPENLRQLQAGFNSGYPKLVQAEYDITDVIAIFKHLCRYYQRPDLIGLTPQNRAILNEFMFHYADVRLKLIKKISEGAKNAWGKANQGEIYEIKLACLKSIVQQECKILNNFLQMYMKSKTWIFGYLSMADFFFYEVCFYLVNFLGSALKNHIIYRNFLNFLILFESQQFFQNHKDEILNRKIFMPFKEKSTTDIMQCFWEGNKGVIV